MNANTINNLNPVETFLNERWTKFLLHKVPSDADLNIIRAKIKPSTTPYAWDKPAAG
jgi:hypothetical protein